ncbi:MAG TPA: type 1 glutamine amidotransferase [Thermoleophilaceae bacterium]|nr:type 1 glutamine amidotransferase [Thermoleophilaceae bacterium]
MRVLSVVHEADAGAGVFGEFETWIPSAGPPPTDFDALMVFGGSMHVDQNDEHRWLGPEKVFLRDALSRGVPILGVCLGSQLLAEAAGATPHRSPEPEIGWYDIEITDAGAADPLLGPLAPSVELFEWHHYVAPLPPGAIELARTPACVQAFRIEGKPAWGLQFHAEVTSQGLNGWLDGWDRSEAIHTALDPERIRAESELRIEEQNEIGRGISARFLAEAAQISNAV